MLKNNCLPTVNQIKTMQQNNSFVIQTSPFDGDHKTLNFFFNQVADLAKINAWDEKRKLFFFKNKLIGTALQYYIQLEASQHELNFEQIRHSFQEYFCVNSWKGKISRLCPIGYKKL